MIQRKSAEKVTLTALYIFIEKNPTYKWTAQFKPVAFEGQL